MNPSVVAIFLLGGVGATLRFAISSLLPWNADASTSLWVGLPWATLAINFIGSLAIGWVSEFAALEHWRVPLMVGLLGGFTTFSTFSLELLRLYQSGSTGAAVLYGFLSTVLCFAGAGIGFRLAT